MTTFVDPIVRLMAQDIIIAADRAQPLGRYPHTRRVGPWVFVSGTSSRRPDNSYAGAEKSDDGQWQLDIKIQTKAVLENIHHYLQLNNGDLGHLVDVTVFLKNMADFDAYNEVYNSFFPETGPCRTTVEVSDLPRPQILIEIKGTAYIDKV
jgi:enamine deaminase RidA (YjgF/YER057c/UK114 family)